MKNTSLALHAAGVATTAGVVVALTAIANDLRPARGFAGRRQVFYQDKYAGLPNGRRRVQAGISAIQIDKAVNRTDTQIDAAPEHGVLVFGQCGLAVTAGGTCLGKVS